MTAVHPMWMNYPELHEELKQVKRLMRDSIQRIRPLRMQFYRSLILEGKWFVLHI